MVSPAAVPLKAPMDPIDARSALREATAPLHAEVDTTLPLARPTPTLADYRAHLQLLSDWTDRLRALPVDARRLDTQAAALAVDLAECDRLLGAPPQPSTTARVDVTAQSPADPDAFGWGVAYVIEGSQLGGQVLYRRLAEPLAPHPLAYLHGAGRDTGARWKGFLAELQQQLATPERVRAACDGAVQAFGLLLACRRAAEPNA
jgi:heme oxygenase